MGRHHRLGTKKFSPIPAALLIAALICPPSFASAGPFSGPAPQETDSAPAVPLSEAGDGNAPSSARAPSDPLPDAAGTSWLYSQDSASPLSEPDEAVERTPARRSAPLALGHFFITLGDSSYFAVTVQAEQKRLTYFRRMEAASAEKGVARKFSTAAQALSAGENAGSAEEAGKGTTLGEIDPADGALLQQLERAKKEGLSWNEMRGLLRKAVRTQSEGARAVLVEVMPNVPPELLRPATPEQISRAMWKYFTYESDERQFGRRDYWQTPGEMIANGKGDCEDFAVFASEFLKANGYQSFIVNIYGRGYAHTVAVSKQGGDYRVFDTDKMESFKASDLRQILDRLYSSWETASIVSFSELLHKGIILEKFTQR